MTGTPLSQLKRWADAPLEEALPLPEPTGMTLLRILKTMDGSLNGRDVQTFRAGEAYELPCGTPGDLGSVFVREGWAEPAEAPTVPAPVSEAPQVPGTGRRKRGGR